MWELFPYWVPCFIVLERINFMWTMVTQYGDIIDMRTDRLSSRGVITEDGWMRE